MTYLLLLLDLAPPFEPCLLLPLLKLLLSESISPPPPPPLEELRRVTEPPPPSFELTVLDEVFNVLCLKFKLGFKLDLTCENFDMMRLFI